MFSIEKLDTSDAGILNGYSDSGFKVILEKHLGYLKTHQDTRTVPIEGNNPLKYKGDLAGWLLSLGVSAKYHWVIYRMNDLYESIDYNGERRNFLVPSNNVIDDLLTAYQQRQDATT